MYTTRNFKTKKAFKEALALGLKLTYFQPGPFGGNEKQDGTIAIEGPHYPAPHTWYATCKVEGGYIVSIK